MHMRQPKTETLSPRAQAIKAATKEIEERGLATDWPTYKKSTNERMTIWKKFAKAFGVQGHE